MDEQEEVLVVEDKLLTKKISIMDKEEKKLRDELQLVNAAASYQAVKRISLIAIIGVCAVAITQFVILNKKKEEAESRVIVLDSNGMTGTGSVQSMSDKDVLNIQVKAAIKYAIPYLYSFNSANYDEQIEKGLKLFGNCGKVIHTEYINGNVREKVFNSNLEVTCEIKDQNIQIVEDKGGLHAQVIFSQTFVNGGVKSARDLTVKMDILRTKISSTNPFGFLIENWIIVSENRG